MSEFKANRKFKYKHEVRRVLVFHPKDYCVDRGTSELEGFLDIGYEIIDCFSYIYEFDMEDNSTNRTFASNSTLASLFTLCRKTEVYDESTNEEEVSRLHKIDRIGYCPDCVLTNPSDYYSCDMCNKPLKPVFWTEDDNSEVGRQEKNNTYIKEEERKEKVKNIFDYVIEDSISISNKEGCYDLMKHVIKLLKEVRKKVLSVLENGEDE